MSALSRLINKGQCYININGINFHIQAFSKNEFVNLTEILDNNMGYSFSLDFNKKIMSTNEKQTEEFINWFNNIEVDYIKINNELNLIFDS